MRLPKLRLASRRLRWLSAVLLCAALVGGVQAQAADDASDPPSRVARLSYLAGDVGFLPAGARDWSDASVNRPLTTGDRLSTSADARAELELGGSTLRIDGGADFGLLDLDDQIAQIELTQGTLSLSVRDLDAGQSIEIDTPTVALVVDRPGNFRVDVGDGTRDTRISVRDGSATVYGEDSAQRSVSAGRSYVFGDSALARVSISDLDGDDAFDAWAVSREQRYVRSDSRQYVSDQVIGYQDLDQYGDWQSDTDYGAVWYPTAVATDWAPYRSGHWAYIAPWGWSWVDDAPWGFAPYHYGRWAHVHGRWGWIPGPRDIRPVYAPALVAFVGGGGWSVGIGSGPVGWFPLGPGEIYNPWYRASRSYYTRVNITNIRVRRGEDRGRYGRDIDNHYDRYRRGLPVRGERYANRNAPRALTTVSGQTFASGRPVRGNAQRVDPRALANATVLPRGIAARPAAGASVLPRSAHARALPTGGFNREVVARRAPPAAAAERVAPTTGQRAQRPATATPSRVRLLGGTDQRTDVRRAQSDRGDARQQQANAELVRQRDAAAVRPMPATGRGLPQRVERSAASDASAQTLPSVPPVRRANRTEGELPSARFARPQRSLPATVTGEGRMQAAARDRVAPMQRARGENSPRPGLSIVSGTATDRAQQAAAMGDNPRTLPQVPRVQRATGDDAPARREGRAGWDERQATMRRTAPQELPQPRQMPAESVRRAESFRAMPRQAPPMPQREAAPDQRNVRSMDVAPPRPANVPRQQPTPATMPQPRMVAPPARGENAAPARSEGNARKGRPQDDRHRKDDRQ